MRQAVSFIAGLLSLRDNPFLRRAWLRDCRDPAALRIPAMSLGVLALLAMAAWALALWRPEAVRGLSLPGARFVAAMVSSVHVWMIFGIVSARAADDLIAERHGRTLDLLLTAPVNPIHMAGMRATYPLLVGLAMSLAALPLYALIMKGKGLSLGEVLALYALYAGLSVRPGSWWRSAGRSYTRRIMRAGEWWRGGGTDVGAGPRSGGVAWLGWIGAIAFVGPALLALANRAASLAELAMVPFTWCLRLAPAIWEPRPFFDLLRIAPVVWLAVLVPLMWGTVALAAHNEVVGRENRVKLRATPPFHPWLLGMTVCVVGFLWPAAMGSTGWVALVGASAGDVGAVLAGIGAVLWLAWAVPVSSSLWYGGTEAGLVLCPEATPMTWPGVLWRELRSGLGAVSVLAFPTAAFLICAALAGGWPAGAVVQPMLRCGASAAVALFYVFSLGRLVTLAEKHDSRAHGIGFALEGILWYGCLAALFPAVHLPEWVLCIQPMSAMALASPMLADTLTGPTWTVDQLPSWGTCIMIQVCLASLICVGSMAYAVRLHRRKLAGADETPPRRRLPLLGRRVRNPIAVRLMRSRNGRAGHSLALFFAGVTAACAFGGALLAPTFFAAMGWDLGIGTRSGSMLGASFAGVWFLFTLVLQLVSSFLAFTRVGREAEAERSQRTIDQLLLTSLSRRQLALGFQIPVWITTAYGAALWAPLAVVTVLTNGTMRALALVVANMVLVLVDPVLGASAGCHQFTARVMRGRPRAVLFMFGISRLLVFVAVMTMAWYSYRPLGPNRLVLWPLWALAGAIALHIVIGWLRSIAAFGAAKYADIDSIMSSESPEGFRRQRAQ